MTYLKIVNDGLIEIEDLTLIGSSTKRGVKGKIGEFGSGNKFSIAWYFRNDCIPTVFRGKDQLKIETKQIQHRSNTVKVITVEGVDTSITTEMGPKWNGWMALRETISNAIDEGGFEMKTVVNPDMVGEENKTIYYIPMNSELDKVISNFNHYFSMDRTPIFSNKHGQMFLRSSDTVNVYRQGIRCWDTNRVFNFDVNLFDIDINESRLTEETAFDYSMRTFINEGLDLQTMDLVLNSEYTDFIPGNFSEKNLEIIKDMVAQGKTFGSVAMSKLAGLLGTSTFDYVISSLLYDQLIKEKIIEGLSTRDQSDYILTEDSERLSEIKYFLKAFNIHNTVKNGMTTKFPIAIWDADTIIVNENILRGNIYDNKEVAHNILRGIPKSIFDTII